MRGLTLPGSWLVAWRARCPGLVRLFAVPAVRRALSVAGWLVLAAYFVFVLLVLVLRYWALPALASHQAEIERAASDAIGQAVRIERIEADWLGLNPRLVLNGVKVADPQGRPALAFDRVESVLSWHSLWRFKPILALLAIEGPVLNVRRDAGGRISIAGVDAEGEADPRIAEWIFEQRRIRIRNAIIVWEDAARKAPPLILEDLQFGLDNRGDHHLIGLSAAPPENLAARIDLRADLRGDLADGWQRLSGRLFAELEYADLAAWRTWVDYPLALRQGRGAVRLWAEWDERGKLDVAGESGLSGKGAVTADLALEDVRVQLGRQQPELALASMRGRFEGSLRGDSWRLAGRQIELSTRDGLRVAPTDIELGWQELGEGRRAGSASATMLDFGALEQLAMYLPLNTQSRELLQQHQPRGRVADLRAAWELNGEQLQRYNLRAKFAGLGLRAAGNIPGAAGLSGEIDASDKGGTLSLENKQSALDLPSVFPVPQIVLDELRARVSWKVDAKQSDVRLEKLEFAGPEAAGAFRGTYHYNGNGPGEIDLSGGLSRADGTAVWRYMPHVVNADTRNWLKRGIVSGNATETKLTLRGDLRHFPFADKKNGEFLITTKAHNVKLDYAPGWPVIEGIEADLSFGVGMRIEANAGRLFGARLANVVAEIKDFASTEEILLLRGQAEGPTGEFLRFIDQSPVASAIDRFTEDMRATGNGKLDLSFELPLRHTNDAKVQGEYRFNNNQVVAVPGLPAITQVSGALNFSEKKVSAREITGNIFGAPMKLAVKNEGERVSVSMSGGMQAREMRKHFESPLFDHVSGQASWKGEVRVRKKVAEFVIESNLIGLTSALPEPFNKSAATPLALRLEKSTQPGAAADTSRDQIRIGLRGIGEALLLRHQVGEEMQLERGALAIGAPLPTLPARGLQANIVVPRVDGDFWRNLLAKPKLESVANGKAANAPLPLRVSLKTPLFRLLGRDFNELDATAVPRESGWQVALNSRQLAGDIYWQGNDKGLLKADLKRLALPAESAVPGAAQAVAEVVDSLPGLDVRVADFALGEKRLGRLEARAHNTRGGVWRLDQLLLQNPDGSLKGKGEWRTRGGNRTSLDFDLAANDIGKLLERLGYPGAVRRGSASLKGELAWDGPLTTIHYPSLAGEMKVTAEKGQFAKLEPGLGKLLGLISLQSLPRRLTLDFRDIFSDGLAFDSIEAKLKITNGIMRISDSLKIDGPAARILMQGEADLKQETQDLTVTVQPELGAMAAVGVVLINPVVGAATLLANKVLQNPLNKVFTFQYRVTGSWADPKVEKTGQVLPALLGDAPAKGKATERKP